MRLLSKFFPLGVPALALVLGMATLSSPWLVLAAGVVVAGVVWWAMLQVVLGRTSVDVAGVASVCISLMGGVWAFMAGLIISRDSTLPLAACLIAFSAGLVAGLLERRRATNTKRLSIELLKHAPETSTTPGALQAGVAV